MTLRADHRRGNVRAGWVIIGCLISFAIAGVRADASGEDRPPTLALEDAQRELEVERERFAREIAALDRDLDAELARAHELSDGLVDLSLETAAKRVETERLIEQAEGLRRAVRRSEAERAEMDVLTREASGHLLALVNQLPPSESRERQRSALTRLEAEGTDSSGCLASLLEVVDSLLQESASSAVFESDVRTPRGERRAAEMLRIGMVLWAWRTEHPPSVAVALRAPRGERGFRWGEGIAGSVRDGLLAAMRAVARRDRDVVVPIDVSQRMVAGHSQGPRTVWGRLAAGGPVMVPLAMVAILSVLLLFERFLFLSAQGRRPERLARTVFDLCGAGKFEMAEKLVVDARGPTARALEACLQNRVRGAAAMEDAVEAAMLRALPGLERFLTMIGLLATIAPLLGLLGTVTGIISSFEGMAAVGSSDPSVLAGGISEALITTATGLMIAIPVLLLHGVATARSDRLLSDAESFGADLLADLLASDRVDDGPSEAGEEEADGASR